MLRKLRFILFKEKKTQRKFLNRVTEQLRLEGTSGCHLFHQAGVFQLSSECL